MNLNATLIAQLVVFLILVFFTMKFVWPPITQALDERAEKIASGLAAADKAKLELSQTHAQTQQELAKAKNESAGRLADAERRAVQIIEEAKAQAAEEAKKIIAAAQAEAANQMAQARDALRNQVAALAVRGAEQILRKEINQNNHGELLQQLQRELV